MLRTLLGRWREGKVIGAIVALMAEVDPEHAVRYLSQMVDESTRVISAAAAAALREIRGKPIPGANPSHP